MQGFRSFHSAWRTIQGIETVNMIRKGQIRWLPKDDILGQAALITGLFGSRSLSDGPSLSVIAVFAFNFATLPIALMADPVMGFHQGQAECPA